MPRFITSPMVTAETEKLNNEQYGACGSGAVWDLILRSALPSSLANDVCDDGMHQNHDQNKVAAAAAAGAPELVAIETLPAMLYSVAVPDGAPVVPVPTVPAEEAIKMIKTTDRAPVQAEAEELTSGKEPTSCQHRDRRDRRPGHLQGAGRDAAWRIIRIGHAHEQRHDVGRVPRRYAHLAALRCIAEIDEIAEVPTDPRFCCHEVPTDRGWGLSLGGLACCGQMLPRAALILTHWNLHGHQY